MLRELATEEAVFLNYGGGYSRATEAVAALERIRKGEYGVCIDCGKNISAARLQIKPEASRCITCRQKYEERTARRLAI
jgi:RNA polymerase-binding transcription factor DksA